MMFDFLNRKHGTMETPSKQVAKERLKVVLLQDRLNVSAHFMACMREDIIHTLSNYMDMNEQELELFLTTNPDDINLIIKVPVQNIRRAGPELTTANKT